MSYGKDGSKQCYETPGGLIVPGEGFSRDAGAGTPPAPGLYGKPGTGKIPDAGVKGSNGGAIGSFFGRGKKAK
jgi:hypothetical protein